MRKHRGLARLFRAHNLAVASLVPGMGIALCESARAGGVPIWNPAEAGLVSHGSGTYTQNSQVYPGSPFNAPIGISTVTSAISYNHTINLYPGGNSNASAGLEAVQSTTTAKIVIGSGTGVSQTDPNHNVSASSLYLYFDAQWTLPANGFGVPISSNFSLPIGAKIGANGSASATVKIDWDYINPSNTEIGEYEYDNTQTWLGGVSGQNILTSFTAPTFSWNPTSLTEGNTLVMTAAITLTADNDSSPTFIEVPTAADFSDMGVTTDQTGFASTDIVDSSVPEPTTAMLLLAGGGAALLRRRRP